METFRSNSYIALSVLMASYCSSPKIFINLAFLHLDHNTNTGIYIYIYKEVLDLKYFYKLGKMYRTEFLTLCLQAQQLYPN